MLPDGGAVPYGWPNSFVRDAQDRDALLVLAHLESNTPRKLHALGWGRGNASACLAAVLGGALGRGDTAIAREVDPVKVRERMRELSIRQVAPPDPEYPERLLGLDDPPACLFVRGRSLSRLGNAVAVVGARNCSPYGRDTAIRLSSQLAEAGITVVSGAAIGIDGAAHEGALQGGGHTVAILGSGHDRPHPKTNAALISRIASEGTVVTEYPPGTVALPRRFPQRNRIIAGLSQGVVVVEGAAGSGSLQTAEHAGEGRQVMAVPGPIDSPLSQAPHDLIRGGAALVANADDVLDALGLFERQAAQPELPIPPFLDGTDEGRALTALSGRPVSLDEVSASCGLEMSRALVALSGLELRGLVEACGGRYRRAPQPRR